MAKGKGSSTKRIFRSADQRFRMPYTIPELWNMGEENRKHVLGDKYEEYEAIYSFGNSNVMSSKAKIDLPPIGSSTAPDVDASVQPSVEDAAVVAQNPTPIATQEKKGKVKKPKKTKTPKAKKSAVKELGDEEEEAEESPHTSTSIESGDTVQIEKKEDKSETESESNTLRDYKF